MQFAEYYMRITWECVHFESASAQEVASVRETLEARGLAVFEMQGTHIADDDGLFDALAESMTFPWYFGRNWNAVGDCLRDM